MAQALAWVFELDVVQRALLWWYRRRHPRLQSPQIEAIYAYSEVPSEPDGYVRTLPRTLFDDPSTRDAWEDLVDAFVPVSWSRAYRLEIRYLAPPIGKKYRAIARPGDPFPHVFDDSDDSADDSADVVFPRILLARLVIRDDVAGDDVVITRRCTKYAGPTRDFKNVRVHDMFPFDDHAENVRTYACVRILDGSFRSWDVPYDSTDFMRDTSRT